MILANLVGSMLFYAPLQVADYTSTEYALKNKANYERNGFGSTKSGRLALKIGAEIIISSIDNEVGHRSKTAQKIMKAGAVVYYGYWTIHNVRQR